MSHSRFSSYPPYCLLGLVLAGIAMSTLLTQGTFDFQKEYRFSLIFFDMWKNLKQFNFSIDRDLIGPEGWLLKNGQVSTYFLPLPALVRGFLNLFGQGRSAIFSELLAGLVFVFSSQFMFISMAQAANFQLLKTKIFAGITLLFISISLPIFILLTYPVMFWESILWGVTLLMLSMSMSIHLLLHTPSKKGLIFFAIVCGLSLFTRSTIILANTLLFFHTTITLYIQNQPSKFDKSFTLHKNFLIKLFLLFGMFGLSLGVFNYIKWGNPLEFYPMGNYIMIKNTNLFPHYFQDGALNIARLSESFEYYFLPRRTNFSLSLPFIKMSPELPAGITSLIDYREEILPITIGAPAYCLGFLLGISILVLAIFKRILTSNFRVVLFGFLPSALVSLIPAVIILMMFANANRYAGDFLPCVALFSIFSLVFLLSKFELAMKTKTALSLSWLSCFISIWVGLLASGYLSMASAQLQNISWQGFSNTPIASLQLNQLVTFKENGNSFDGKAFLESGWSTPEAWGTWSIGPESDIRIPIPYRGSPKKIILRVRPFLTDSIMSQKVQVKINGNFYKQVEIFANTNLIEINNLPSLRPFNNSLEKLFHISGSQEWLTINLSYSNPTEPIKVGLGEDARPIAIGLESLIVE